MTGVIKVNELQGRTTADDITVTVGSTTMQLQSGLAKAMAQYFGATNVLQSGSLNHSSVTDNGTGDFTHNFTNNFGSTVYNVVGSSDRQAVTITSLIFYEPKDNSARATGSMAMECIYTNEPSPNRSMFDLEVNDFIAYGDLA